MCDAWIDEKGSPVMFWKVALSALAVFLAAVPSDAGATVGEAAMGPDAAQAIVPLTVTVGVRAFGGAAMGPAAVDGIGPMPAGVGSPGAPAAPAVEPVD